VKAPLKELGYWKTPDVQGRFRNNAILIEEEKKGAQKRGKVRQYSSSEPEGSPILTLGRRALRREKKRRGHKDHLPKHWGEKAPNIKGKVLEVARSASDQKSEHSSRKHTQHQSREATSSRGGGRQDGKEVISSLGQ